LVKNRNIGQKLKGVYKYFKYRDKDSNIVNVHFWNKNIGVNKPQSCANQRQANSEITAGNWGKSICTSKHACAVCQQGMLKKYLRNLKKKFKKFLRNF